MNFKSPIKPLTSLGIFISGALITGGYLFYKHKSQRSSNSQSIQIQDTKDE